MTRAELVELRGKIDRAIAAAGERDRQRALKAAEDLAREHGFSLAELVGSGTAKGRSAGTKRGPRADATSSAPSNAKYRNPDNADQTWSGRGRRPAWFNEALAQGRSAEELRAG
ncbi:H-NS histone family protein [Rubellimicrobium rubrum]|uniref:H-NS histone family protein n=2 Tax=Rubellimicrobium rubrum TaxID=2585369 RepID=A0A5C4MMS6_9RHOB|nr:H-NS histone family protein [Rubellimicrobium rubrum]